MRHNSFNSGRVNWTVVGAVALLCAVSLTLFFVLHSRSDAARQEAQLRQQLEADAAEDRAAATAAEILYYEQEADEYIASLPADKQLLARVVDSANHYIVYFERSEHPSCYLLDLESHTTSVLFGGENGFYCDTKLLIVGTIHDWMQVGDIVYFVADNRAPEASEHNAVVVFSLNLSSHALRYVDTGFEATFIQPDQLRIGHATLLYYSLFTGENVYGETTVTRRLPDE